MASENDLTPPQSTRSDVAHAVARGALSLAPIVGGPAVELFNMIVASPLERRRDSWMDAVAVKLRELMERENVTAESLQNNDAFISSILQATQAAAKTHEQEKLDALRNAVLNSALSAAPEETIRQMFIRFVDELTAGHLQILSLFHDASGWFARHNRPRPQYHIAGSLVRLIADAFPELGGQRTLYELIVSDLNARKLCEAPNVHTNMSGDGAFQKRTTDIGDRFLQFISEPKAAS